MYVVSTPIGNLKDVTIRALEVLEDADYIACEDTRRTLKLLNTYGIKKPLISFHSKSRHRARKKIIDFIHNGCTIAMVADSGTPLVSDPGSRLVQTLIEQGCRVVPVPGPSAVHSALVAAGLPFSGYVFAGFLSSKRSRRKKRIRELSEANNILVFFESPHRIIQFLEDLLEVLGNRKGCVAREMTKKFETYYRGSLAEILEAVKSDGTRGEYTVVVDNRSGE